MDEMHEDHSQLALAFYAGILHGIFQSWNALRRPYNELIDRIARDGREISDLKIFLHHGNALITLRGSLDRLTPPPGGELAWNILVSAMQSEIDVLRAAMTLSDEHLQHLADRTEDSQAYLVAWDKLCRLAGLPDDESEP
jgi:hypothetical protein